jgi:Leucine-rich repeat (LRR) protein
MAAVSRSLQQAVLVQDPRRLSLTLDPANTAHMGSGLAQLVRLSHPSSSNGGRTGPLRLILKHGAADNLAAQASSVVAPNAAVRMLLYTPMRVVTHLEVAFANDITQADVDVLGTGMPALRAFSLEQNTVISSLDLKSLPRLKEAHVNKCPKLTNLSVAGCTRLQQLNCKSNSLTTLYVSGCSLLKVLLCESNTELATLGGLADTAALEHLNVRWCALTSLDLTHAVHLHTLWLPERVQDVASLALPPNTRIECLLIASANLLASLISSGHIASLRVLWLEQCTVNVDVVANVPGLQKLGLLLCSMPKQWTLPALPTLHTLILRDCTGLTALDASSATALTCLTLSLLARLRSLVLPAGLQELTCEGLPQLADVDLRAAAPNVKVAIKRCPDFRLLTAHMTIEP